jgi:hypothetical protein
VTALGSWTLDGGRCACHVKNMRLRAVSLFWPEFRNVSRRISSIPGGWINCGLRLLADLVLGWVEWGRWINFQHRERNFRIWAWRSECATEGRQNNWPHLKAGYWVRGGRQWEFPFPLYIFPLWSLYVLFFVVRFCFVLYVVQCFFLVLLSWFLVFLSCASFLLGRKREFPLRWIYILCRRACFFFLVLLSSSSFLFFCLAVWGLGFSGGGTDWLICCNPDCCWGLRAQFPCQNVAMWGLRIYLRRLMILDILVLHDI